LARLGLGISVGLVAALGLFYWYGHEFGKPGFKAFGALGLILITVGILFYVMRTREGV
jgi:hypothetical protein